MIYDVKSSKADEFINHEEILDTLEYAQKNKDNYKLIDDILKQAATYKGLNHRQASVLIACQNPEYDKKILQLANQIKHDVYGNRIVLFAPLYLSNYCVNGCVYCPYHYKNSDMQRKKLTQDEIRSEVIALQDMGHKRLAIEAGEDPTHNTMDYYLQSIQTIYDTKHKNGAIRRVNVNIAATSVENYKKLKDAQIGTYILFQETYNKQSYKQLHPTGPKSNYEYHTTAMDRAMEAGIDDVGVGVLFGLESYKYELAGLLMHAQHLEATFGVGPHTISVPRIRPAKNIDPDSFDGGIDDDTFEKLVAVIRVAVPYTGIIVSTRESQQCRARLLDVGVSQISGASNTSVGGYTDQVQHKPSQMQQFDIEDNRTLDQVASWLIDMGHIPSFCTACYTQGRTGDRFMSLAKSGQIVNCCHPNSLLTLKEYLQDYASHETKLKGQQLIDNNIDKVTNPKVKSTLKSNLQSIEQGLRDFRF